MAETKINMQTTKDNKTELSVALLMDDIREAKQLSQVFRKAGVIPHIYEDLRSFWNGTLEETPSLSVVDVRLTNQGELLLKNHPHVKADNMPLAFFYTSETEPLLYATYEILHLGEIKKSGAYEGQTKAVLRRLNKMNELEEQARLIKNKNTALDGQLVKLVEVAESLKEKDFYFKFLKSICGRLDLQKNADDFFSALGIVFGSVREFKEFAALELSYNGQKLVSPKMYQHKFKEIPSLWLGKTCANGIEFFAQNMASQVALDLMGGDLMSLLIRGKNGNPDKMIFIRTEDEEFLSNFDWESFERYLSGLHCYFEVRNDANFEKDDNVYQPWELFSILDQIMYGKLPETIEEKTEESEEYALINLNFGDLIDLIRAKRGMRFYWRKFFNEFFARFETQKRVDFKLTCMGVQNIGMLVDREEADSIFNDLKTYSLRYPYWRYFEDVDVVLARNMKPELKMIPMSSEAYMRFLEDGDAPKVSAPEPKKEKKRKREVFWTEGPSSSM